MEAPLSQKPHHPRGRGTTTYRGVSRNKQWVAGQDSTRNKSQNHGEEQHWERGGHRGGRGGRGLGRGGPRRGSPFPSTTSNGSHSTNVSSAEATPQRSEPPSESYVRPQDEPDLETMEEREAFYQQLLKAREAERKKAMAEGKMDDPTVPKRLEDAITIVGTCPDMCPRFERYRRERENNLFEWETKPGTKRIDHERAVKMYERAAGDKVIPSDLRPPHVLKHTLDYLFHDLMARGGFSRTFTFIRDRSRAVRNDFAIQHEKGELAIECHERCARFHILGLHVERDSEGFSFNLEQQQLMNTLQSLKEFYEDQRPTYESPYELEMRVYHRLIHIRDQRDRHESLAPHIVDNPVFKLTNDFRAHVQKISSPITKVSKLLVDERAMEIFGELAGVLREQGNGIMIYLIACLLESVFGKDAIDDIEGLRGELAYGDVIDGAPLVEGHEEEETYDGMYEEDVDVEVEEEPTQSAFSTSQTSSVNGFGNSTSSAAELNNSLSSFTPMSGLPSEYSAPSAFSGLTAAPNPFGGAVFGQPGQGNAFAQLAQNTTAQLGSSTPSEPVVSAFGKPSYFGAPAPSAPTPEPPKSGIFSTPLTSFPSTSTPPLVPAFSWQPQVQSQQNTPPSSLFPTPPATTQGGLFPSSSSPALNPQASAFVPGEAAFNKPMAVPVQSSSTSLFPTTLPFSISAPSAGTTTAISPAAPVVPPPTLDPPMGQESFVSFTPPHAVASTSTPFSLPPPSQPLFAPPQPPNSNNTRLASLPKLDTSPTTTSPTTGISRQATIPDIQPEAQSSLFPAQGTPQTPLEPPRLARQQPISLPSTPTLPPSGPSIPRLDLLRGSFQTTLPSSSSEILSPISLQSPSVSRQGSLQNFAGLSTPIVPSTRSSFTLEHQSSPLSGKGKGKEKAREAGPDVNPFVVDDTPDVMPRKDKGKGKSVEVAPTEEQVEDALAFERKSTVVKTSFHRWHSQTVERMAYQEAVRQSETYKEKIKRERARGEKDGKKRSRAALSRSASISSMDVEVHYPTSISAPVKKRARKRISNVYQPPRTDEDLARRLQENHEEHQSRWASGTFLEVVRKVVQRRSITTMNGTSSMNGRSTHLVSSSMLKQWRAWISLNPESDATAIWMEKKFGIPESGQWVSESIFSIPVVPSSTVENEVGYPGILVFECTPLDDVGDELEKKYRILDDCSRLRDILKALPERRYFVPTLLIVWWSEGEGKLPESDLTVMLKTLVRDSTISSFGVFSISASTKDLDNKLSDALSSLTLDVEGSLVKTLTLGGVFRVFDDKLRPFVAEWIDNCTAGGEFNWVLYGRLAQAIVGVLSKIEDLLAVLLGRPRWDPLPAFEVSDVEDSHSAYDAAFRWLSNTSLHGLSEDIVADLQGHQSLGQVFPPTVFLDHLRELAQYRISMVMGNPAPDTSFPILLSGMESSLQELQHHIDALQGNLSQVLNLSMRRSKRRSLSSSTDTDPNSKRRRLSGSASSNSSFLSRSPTPPSMSGSLLNGNDHDRVSLSPVLSEVSTSTATGTTSSPRITVAMLRALTKSLREKYVPGS